MTTHNACHSTRPRSGSWTPPSTGPHKTGNFLVNLKSPHRKNLASSPSLMTLPSYHIEKNQPPLPGSACSISPTSLVRCETVPDKPLPNPPKKKIRGFPKSNSMATLTRLFKKLGKPQHDKSNKRQPSKSKHRVHHPILQHRCSSSSIRPETPPVSISGESKQHIDRLLTRARSMRRSMSVDAPRQPETNILNAGRQMQEDQGRDEEEEEEDEEDDDIDDDEQTQKHEMDRRNMNAGTENELETFPDQIINPADAHDSNIVVDRLSKRFSGGHFGSAGGLILSTLPLGQEDEKDDEDDVTLSSAEHNAHLTKPCESLSTLSLTPPSTEGGLSNGTCSTAESYAMRIWKEDRTVYKDIERVAEWIGDGSPLGTDILKHYMSFFDFKLQKLEDAFRILCGKLHLKAEAQQIDRVLEEFANRYWTCNTGSIFGSQDIVHAIAYSLLLLNTDLHVALNEHKKMTRSAFVRNTMNAIRAQMHIDNDEDGSTELRRASISMCSTPDLCDLRRTPSARSTCSSVRRDSYITETSRLEVGSRLWQLEIEAHLKSMYSSIRSNQVLHPSAEMENSDGYKRHSRKLSLSIPDNKYRAFKRNMATMVKKSARDSYIVSECDTESETSTSTAIQSPSTYGSASKSMRHQLWSQQQHRRRSVVSSMSHGSHYTHANSSTTLQPASYLFHHAEIPISYTSSAPFYKEGPIVCKHLLESANQKAKHREWKECFMVVDRGDIRMYKLDNAGFTRKLTLRGSMMMSRDSLLDSDSGIPSTLLQPPTLGNNDWLANAKTIGEIDLKHTLSNALPSGYSRQRPHAAALQQSNGGIFLFEATSADQVLEWVATFNYWAARESKEPLTGGVGNIDYGWSYLDDVENRNSKDLKRYTDINIHEWQPPSPPEVSSNFEETAQLAALEKHVKELNDSLDKHKDLKSMMEVRFKKTNDLIRARAMSNWESKSQYLLHEIIKYQNYCDAIEKSLALQDKAIREETKV